MKIHGYPKILNLGHKYLEPLFNEEVVVEEKVDGSQFSFRKLDDTTVIYKSKNCELIVGATDKLFTGAVTYIESIKSLLMPGWTYRGEVLHAPQHNTIRYGRVPQNNLIIFDIDIGEERFLTYEQKKAETQRIGLEVVPILSQGKIEDYQTLKGLLDTDSVLSTADNRVKLEGIVIKNYSRVSIDGKTLMGKWVREEFKELNHGVFKNANPTNNEIIERLVGVYRHENRWKKAVQHLSESGGLLNDPKDIGPLMKEINVDVLTECEAEIKQKLWDYAWPKISRGITRGFPEFYKEMLAQKQFTKEQQNVEA